MDEFNRFRRLTYFLYHLYALIKHWIKDNSWYTVAFHQIISLKLFPSIDTYLQSLAVVFFSRTDGFLPRNIYNVDTRYICITLPQENINVSLILSFSFFLLFPGLVYIDIPGQKVSVSMQKNLDHYYASAPGNFSVYLWTGDYKTSWFVGSINDSPAPTMSLYSVNFQVPTSLSGGNYVVQTVYYTNNPGAPPNFYQCSDVLIVSANATEVEAAKHHNCMKHD